MLSLAVRGCPWLTVACGTVLSTASLTGVGEDNGEGPDGDAMGDPGGDPVRDAVAGGEAECVDREEDSLQETNDAAAVKRTAVVARALPVMSRAYGGHEAAPRVLLDVGHGPRGLRELRGPHRRRRGGYGGGRTRVDSGGTRCVHPAGA